jgi:SpoVK/Ycf46/Vps4 family AAA+-type ATPase
MLSILVDNILSFTLIPVAKLTYLVGKLESAFEDVILEGEVIDTIRTLVYLSKLRTEAASKALISQIKIKGALLYGPPGTGKTHLARAVAKSTESSMLVLQASAINSCWVGETEKYITAAFSLARKLFPCIVFLDEVDALFYSRRSGDRSWQRTAITQFLQEMDGLVQDEQAPFVLVATNRPGDLDNAFLRRLPQKIPFGLPDCKGRASILRLFLKQDDLDGVDVDRLARLTNGYSGSDLKSLCGEAALMWAIEQQLALKDRLYPKAEKDSNSQSKSEGKELKKETAGEDSIQTQEAPLSTDDPEAEKQESVVLECVVSDVSDTATYSDSETTNSGTTDTTVDSELEPEISVEKPVVKLCLNNSHFTKALQKIRPSVTEKDMEILKEFTEMYSPATKFESDVR